MSEEIYQSLKEMVDMMNCGDEYGKDSPWHQRATKALNEYSPSVTQELLHLKELECKQLVKDKAELVEGLQCMVDKFAYQDFDTSPLPFNEQQEEVAFSMKLLERLG